MTSKAGTAITLVHALEAALMGAHVHIDGGNAPDAEWLAERIRDAFTQAHGPGSGIQVTVVGPQKLSVNGPASLRTLEARGTWWTLCDSANPAGQPLTTPGQVAPVLAAV